MMQNTAKKTVSGLGRRSSGIAQHDSSSEANRDCPLPVIELDRQTYSRALDCVHCGLCLPACPTYTENGLEGDSPRGRITLMKELADGRIAATQHVIQHLDLCLDCRACETACPSGVVYHELIERVRPQLEPMRKLTLSQWLARFISLHVVAYPVRLKLAVVPARVMQRLGLWPIVARVIGRVAPASLEKMQRLLPEDGPLWESPLSEHYPPCEHATVDGKPRAVVGFLAGCVNQVMFQSLNRKTIAVLQAAGCDVIVPRDQRCCGAIHHHNGCGQKASQFAWHNIVAFSEAQVDFVVNNAAGCGAMLKEYEELFRDDAHRIQQARDFSGKVRDICELLVELDWPNQEHFRKSDFNATVTYHDACHLAHAQKIAAAPRYLLQKIPGVKLIPLAESDMCCGAAGTYNLTQPDMAQQLAQRKIKHIRNTGSTICVTGNVGCAMQIRAEAIRAGHDLKVLHPVEVLFEALDLGRMQKKTAKHRGAANMAM